MPTSRAQTALAVPLWILAAIATVFFLRATRTVLVPIALSLLAAVALYPVVLWLERAKIPRTLGAALIVLTIAGLGALGAWSLKDDFASTVRTLPAQIRDVREKIERQSRSSTVSGLQQSVAELRKTAESGSLGGAAGPQSSGASGGADSAAQPSALQNYLWQGSSDLLALAGHLTVITFLVFFLLVGAREWRQRLMTLAGDLLSSRRTGAEVMDDITGQMRRFLIVQLVTAVIVGVTTWIVLLLFGAPAPVFWGAAAGVLNSVPYFGPAAVSAGLGLVGLFAGGTTMGLQLAGVALVITSLEGWLLTPLLLGKATRMNTLAVFISLLAWSWAWGVWGTLLAVPLMTMVKSVCDHVEPLHPVSRLLAE